MSYLWIPALSIELRLHEGEPVEFQWHGKIHCILRITRHWRVDVEWWRLRIWRDYYKVVTNTGLLAVVYYDLLDEQWYLQQVYD